MKYIILSTILVACSALFILTGCSSKAPDNIGLHDGQFAPCPQSPNCVSSQEADADHKVDPITARGDEDKVMVDLSNAIESMYGGKVIRIEGTYLYAQFTSRIMRYVDDLECHYDKDKGLIQIRSASRIGYSDLGANRKRVEELRVIFAKTQ